MSARCAAPERPLASVSVTGAAAAVPVAAHGPGSSVSTGSKAFLFSPFLDSAAFLLPIALAAALSPFALMLHKDHVPLSAHFCLVIATDVAHVWGTAFRTYLDRRELLRRPWLYLLCPPAAFLGSFTLHYVGSPQIFWTAMSYYAMYHFVKQDFGLVALFVARAGVRPSKHQMTLEKYTVYAAAAFPVLIWHAQPTEAFRWFNGGEQFVFTTPASAVRPLLALYVLAACHYVFWEVWFNRHGRPVNWGKLFVMAGTWVTWGLGTLCDKEVLTLAWLNLFHGIPFMVMVGVYCRKRWAALPPSACTDRVVVLLTRQWYLFVPCLISLALVEDVLWDVFVWQDYVPRLWDRYFYTVEGELPELDAFWTSVATAALSVPQIVHYILDGYIWRFDGSNLGLREYLLGPPPAPHATCKAPPALPTDIKIGEDSTQSKGLHTR